MRLVRLACWVVFLGQITVAKAETKPQLEQYSNYTDFWQALMAYKHIHSPSPVELPLTEHANDDAFADERLPPPLLVAGPENIDSAVEQAKHFIHPIYKALKRYNRSTYQSFSLHPADVSVLDQVQATGMDGSMAELNEQELSASSWQTEDPLLSHQTQVVTHTGVLSTAPSVVDILSTGQSTVTSHTH